MIIRHATESDRSAVVAMGRKFYETTHYTQFADFEEASASMIFENLLTNGACLVAEADGKPVGMVGLIFVPFLFNVGRKVACEVMWWVEPNAQGLGAGKALLEAVTPACDGCVAIQMIHLESSPPQAAALYERNGFRLREHSYQKDLLWAGQPQ